MTIENSPQLIYPKSASGSVSLNGLGGIITNAGAGGNISLSLPSTKVGFTFTFRVEAPYTMTLVPYGGEQMIPNIGSGLTIESSGIGDVITSRRR